MLTVVLLRNKLIPVLFAVLWSCAAGSTQKTVTQTQRFLDASSPFLGTLYQFDSLEDPFPNACSPKSSKQKPSFDCFSFVQTVLSQITPIELNQIRYQKKPYHYLHRYHFASIEWNLAMINKGLLVDITPIITTSPGKQQAQILSVAIDRNAFWEKKISSTKHNQKLCSEWLATHNRNHPMKTTQQWFIPKKSWLVDQHLDASILKQLPAVTLIEVVRKNWPNKNKIGTELAVSHMGFLVHHNHKWFLRHASSIENRVVDVPWEEYVKRTFKSATIVGFSVFEIL